MRLMRPFVIVLMMLSVSACANKGLRDLRPTRGTG